MISSDHILDVIFVGLGVVFKNRAVAPLIILPAIVLTATLLWLDAIRRTRPWMRAANNRIKALRASLGADPDLIAQRAAFAANFETIDRTMSAAKPCLDLARAWLEFHETIVDETKTPIRNTTRPLAFFPRSTPNIQGLAFWSNVFVGIGLVLTFLGIVVALDETARGMAGANVAATKIALVTLLTIASVKFFASIAGLFASLMLRFAEHRLQKSMRRRTNLLCDMLERGLLFMPPQLLAAQQLDELKRQSAQLERFNSDLAITIGEQVGARFQAAVAPIEMSLGSLNESMKNMSLNLREGLGEGAADAMNAAASGELRALGQSLEGLRKQMELLPGQVGGSGEEAARQIRAAGADFVEAAREIRQAFEQLTGRVDSLGESHSNLISDATKAFVDQHKEATKGIADVLRQLDAAGRDSAVRMSEQISTAIATATEDSRASLNSSFAQTSKAFAGAGQSIIEAIQQTGDRISALAVAIERSERGAAGTAEAFQSSSDSARLAATRMIDAGKSFEAASTPVSDASRAIHQAVERIGRMVEEGTQARAHALEEIRNLAAGLKETNSSALTAWQSYEARFAGVDEDLTKTLGALSKVLADAMEEFRKFAHDVDLEMSKAVGRFGSSLGAIEEHAEVISDLADSMRKREILAAE